MTGPTGTTDVIATSQPTATSDPTAAPDPETLVVGVDVGGTKIAVLVTTPDGAVLGRATNASSVTDQDGAAEAIAAVHRPRPRGARARTSRTSRSWASVCPVAWIRSPAT